MTRVQSIITLAIAACVTYFVIGGILVVLGWFALTNYAIAGGVVGGLASVLGLASLVRPALSQSDLDKIESQSLRQIAETTERINELEASRSEAQEELTSLAIQKDEMKVLVQKASLSLFLQEQRRLYSKKIHEELAGNRVLEAHVSELVKIDRKLSDLNEEIESDPNVDLLKNIVAAAKRDEDLGFELDFDDPFSFGASAVRAISRVLRNALQQLVRRSL